MNFLFRRSRGLIPVYVLASLLPGCTAFKSHTITERDGRANGGRDKVGLCYLLPKALLKIEGKPSEDSPLGYDITVTKIIKVDSRREHRLNWAKNPFHEDQTESPITVDAQGLLTNVEMNVTDKVPDIITDLANSTVNIFKIAGGGAQNAKVIPPPSKLPESFSVTFDPLDAAERKSACNKIESCRVHISICPPTYSNKSCIGDGLDYDAKSAPSEDNQTIEEMERDGLLFHPPTAVELRFTIDTLNFIGRETVTVPNLDLIACIPFKREPLVASKTKIKLVDGTPSEITIHKPSPIKAFTGIISSVTDIVAKAIPSFNVNINRQSNKLDAQTSLLEKQTAYINAQKALVEATAAARSAGAQKAAVPSNLAPQDVDLRPADPTIPTTPPPDLPPSNLNPATNSGAQNALIPPNPAGKKKLKFKGSVELPK